MSEDRDFDQHHHSHHHKKENKGWIAIAVAVFIVAMLVIVGLFGLKNAKSILAQANEMKSNLSTAIACIKEKDPDGAESAIEKADSVYKEMEKTLNVKFWTIASKMPFVGGDIKSVKELMSIYGNASDTIIKPFITQMRNHPLSNLKVDGGFNISLVNSYLDFADSIRPQIDDINKRMQNIEFKVLPKEKIEGILGKFSGLMQTFDSFKKYAPLIRAFCGSGENKSYLVLAQNSAEIRASGGFPGSVGTITITDGVLRVGDFSSISHHINIYYPDDFVMPEREIELFGNDYSYLARDADYNPNFERMASLIKLGYNYEVLDRVDGVVSFTPIVIERLLKYTGTSFTIDDGSQITGDNAMQIIQRELYYKQGTGVYTNDYVDSLFSEVAKKAMKQFVEGFDVKKVAEYVKFFEEGFADRSVMLWIDNPEAEEVVKQCGCSGNVNFDSTKPESGIFFSCWNAARLGMHIDIQPTIVQESTNDKGQKEYNIEVKYYNAISAEEIGMGSYIAGGCGGSIPGYIYFFAPAGGTISDFNVSNGLGISMSDYAGLQVGYSKDFWLNPGETIVVSYKVTTAEGADSLRIVTTPTIRNAK